METKDNAEAMHGLTVALQEKVRPSFSSLSRPVLCNMIGVIVAVVMLWRTSRGWYGRMTLSGIARCMKTGGDLRCRYKRLDRFLTNDRFEPGKTGAALLEFAGGGGGQEPLLVLIDQSAIWDVQVLVASFPCQGRSIPFCVETFEYGKLVTSQNQIEREFFARLHREFGQQRVLILVMDRGYASVQYLSDFQKQEQLYIIRGCSNVTVEYQEAGQAKRISLGRLSHRQGAATRYRRVAYHGKEKVLVDIIVYREKGFKEPWFLIVPAGVEDRLPTEQVVQWYRTRMRIEVTFRDFKSHLGLRGLHLHVAKADKIRRLLLCLAMAYILLLALGDCDLARQFRRQVEVVRRKRRHGTRRTLSVLTVALFMASDSFLLSLSNFITLLTSIVTSSAPGLCSVS